MVAERLGRLGSARSGCSTFAKTEWADGHLPRGPHVHFPEPARWGEELVAEGPIYTLCRSGHRPAAAASTSAPSPSRRGS